MKTRIIIFSILLFCGTIINAQEYRSLVQNDRNPLGKITTEFNPATISLNANSISIKYDKIKEPMTLYFHEKAGVQDHGEFIRTIYILSNDYGYNLIFVDKYKNTQTKENYKYNIKFVILMVDGENANLGGKMDVTRYTIFFSTLK